MIVAENKCCWCVPPPNLLIAGAKNTKAQTAVDTGLPGRPTAGCYQSRPNSGLPGRWLFSRNPARRPPNHPQYGRIAKMPPVVTTISRLVAAITASDTAPGLSAAMPRSTATAPRLLTKADKNAAFELIIWPGPGVWPGGQVRHQLMCRCAAVVIQPRLLRQRQW